MHHWGIFTVLGVVLLSVERCRASQAFLGNLQGQFSQPGAQYRPSVVSVTPLKSPTDHAK
jgi:hypothetical protein